MCDTDGDGLPDVQEAEYGTNPNSRDTDNDGLNDDEEIYHQVMNCVNGQLVVTNNWMGGIEIMIAPGGVPITTSVTLPQAMRVWVSSDPTLADADDDGIPDDAEYELATSKLPNGQPHWFARLDPDGNPYNPNVCNTSPLQVLVTTDARTGYVKPGQTVVFTTTVSQLIKFDDGVLEVTSRRPGRRSSALRSCRQRHKPDQHHHEQRPGRGGRHGQRHGATRAQHGPRPHRLRRRRTPGRGSSRVRTSSTTARALRAASMSLPHALIVPMAISFPASPPTPPATAVAAM